MNFLFHKIQDIVKTDQFVYPDSPTCPSVSKLTKRSSETKERLSSNKKLSNNYATPPQCMSPKSSAQNDGTPSTPEYTSSKSKEDKIQTCTVIPRKERCSTNETDISLASQRCLDCTETCPICWEGYKAGEKVCWSKNKNCNHAFHFDCIVTWLVDNDECPLCRSPYLTKKKEKKDGGDSRRTRTNSSRPSSNRLTRLRSNRS